VITVPKIDAARLMKTFLSTSIFLIVFVLTAVAENTTTNFVGVWKVNWEKTPAVKALPQPNVYFFKTVDEYRQYVTRRAKGIVLDIQTKNTAVLRYANGKSEKYSWERSKLPEKYDIWLQTWPHFLSGASIGHGFKVSDTNTAIFTFQLEWNENVATRVPLVMERQLPNPGKSK
jgi:hypothetical protein